MDVRRLARHELGPLPFWLPAAPVTVPVLATDVRARAFRDACMVWRA